MKSLLIALPTLLQVAVIAALYFAATSGPVMAVSPFEPSRKIRATEIHQLRKQRDRIDDRLSELDGRVKSFNPRGIGSESTDVPTSVPSTYTLSKQESK